ncbi:hypothetical protein ACQEVS_03255 [Streptomyces sp. CA-181903]|uniref:hypothetical protein n=1 Tax=Streptomyces sp. CA-181903 TaxID=3240055 RepID=UPI003D8C1ECE
MGEESDDDFHRHIGEDQPERDAQPAAVRVGGHPVAVPAVTVTVAVVMPVAVSVSMIVGVAVMGIVPVTLPVRRRVAGMPVRLLHETPSFRAGQGK